jgi:hypothetical protein
MTPLSILLFASLAFLLALRTFVVARGWTGIDTYYHLTVSREIGKWHHLPKALDRFAFHGAFSYPPLYHIILALVPVSFSRFLSLCWDMLQAYLAFYITFQLTAHNLILSLLSAAIFLSIPENFQDSLSVNPRPFATLLMSASVFCILLWPSLTFVVLFVILYGLLLISHKMTVQVSWFVFVPMGIVLWTLAPLLAVGVVLGFAFAVLVSGGFYLSVLREHLAYLQFHIKYGSLTTGTKAFPNPIVFFKSNPFLLALLLAVPQVILFRNLLLLLVIVVATVVFAGVWRFGDAHRFLTVSSCATAIVVAASANTEWFAVLCSVLFAYCIWRQIGVVRKLAPPFLASENLLQAFRVLKAESHERLLCLPLSYSYAGAYFTGKTLIAGDASMKGLTAELELSKKLSKIENVCLVLEENRVGLVMVDTKALPECPRIIESCGFARFASSGEYAMFRFQH